MATPISAALRAELAPTGRLRAGLNRANFLLVNRDSASGDPRGVAPDLARELGKRLGVAVDFVSYGSPGDLAEAAKSGAWDVAFLGAEPARATEIEFSPAYAEIECTYLVPAGSPLHAIADVDREGVRISVSARSAYDLYLSRTVEKAQLVRSEGLDASFERFVADGLDALAGLRPRLVADVKKLPGARVLEGRFTEIQQAVGTPKGRAAGARYLREFVEDLKASGFIARAIERHKAHGLSVAPAAQR
ncbi:MAG: transporter substrate-binding domain-containing protein [Burkholderiales bacterium]|nr:transporter substrate-binding domain-containing protein [Burkholderiales bacterium]